MSSLWSIIRSYMLNLYIPKVRAIDVIEIIILAALIYILMNWIKRTRAFNLLRGILIIVIFVIIAYLLQMSTILWILKKVGSIALIALVIIFQPELRRVLEQLGQTKLFSKIVALDPSRDKGLFYSDNSINEIIRAVTEMSSLRIGALIVMEQSVHLTEYINTGIDIDAKISEQLLTNVFEHNTPLHDGAVIIRGDRVLAATCYLPLSESDAINKRFGTRHRAGVGISEVSDCFAVIVSEETGRISYAYKGALTTGVSVSTLREQLYKMQKVHKEPERRAGKIWGRGK